MKPKRIDRRMVAYHFLRDRIISAEIAPGSRLTERQIAEQLGTSTVPIREALLLLVGHHLVTAHNDTGYQVEPIYLPRADSTLRLQVHLQAEAAAETARRKDPLTEAHLDRILADASTPGRTWNDDPSCTDHAAFHLHIAAHAQHEALAEAINNCLIHTERIRRHLLREGAEVAHTVDAHAALVHALVTSPAIARKAARDHAEAHRQQLLSALRP